MQYPWIRKSTPVFCLVVLVAAAAVGGAFVGKAFAGSSPRSSSTVANRVSAVSGKAAASLPHANASADATIASMQETELANSGGTKPDQAHTPAVAARILVDAPAAGVTIAAAASKDGSVCMSDTFFDGGKGGGCLASFDKAGFDVGIYGGNHGRTVVFGLLPDGVRHVSVRTGDGVIHNATVGTNGYGWLSSGANAAVSTVTASYADGHTTTMSVPTGEMTATGPNGSPLHLAASGVIK